MGNSVYCEMVVSACARLGLGLDSCTAPPLSPVPTQVFKLHQVKAVCLSLPYISFPQVKVTAELCPQLT